MQQTRRHILDILRERGESTVEELVDSLRERIRHNITAVTVRHHLDILRGENLVSAPAIRRSGSPGRPQYVYNLTDEALKTFPNNYQNLMNALMNQMKSKLGSSQVNVILDGVADQMIESSHLPALQQVPMEERLNHVIGYLCEQGYEASWEPTAEGFVIHTRNCPYHRVANDHAELCLMDMRLIAGLVGVAPRTLGRMAQDEESCTYLIPTTPKTAK